MNTFLLIICFLAVAFNLNSQEITKEDFCVGYVKNNLPVFIDKNLFINDSIILRNLCGYLPHEDLILISFPFEIQYVNPIRSYGLLVYKIKIINNNNLLFTTLIPLSLSSNNKLYLPNTIQSEDRKKLIKFAKLTDLPECRITKIK
jgi:hypothetical protein